MGEEIQPYKFGGKEYDKMLGLDQYDFHARQYDAATIRFTSPDPHAENYFSWSPYAYCANNPIRITDPTGMDWYWSKDGTALMWREGNEDTYTETYTGEDGTEFTIEFNRYGESFTQIIGSTVVLWNQNEVAATWEMPSFSQKELSGMEQIAQSDNAFVGFAYNLVNDVAVTAQSFLGFAFNYGPENELTGGRGVYNLDGTENFKMADSYMNTVGTFLPAGANGTKGTPKGLSFNKMNAARFSKTFKGNLSRLPARTRGKINVQMNNGIELVNEHLLTPTIITSIPINSKKKK